MEDYLQDPQLVDAAPNVVEPKTWGETVTQDGGLSQVGSGLSAVAKPLQSTNFVSGATGWRINSNGDAEFNNTTIRGVANYVSLPTHQPINGASTPVPITLHSSGFILKASASDADLDDFFGFVDKNYSAQTPSAYLGSTESTSTTFSHTLESGTDRYVFVTVVAMVNSGSVTAPSGVTWNSNTMTQVGGANNAGVSQITLWKYAAGTGVAATGNVVVTGLSGTGLASHTVASNYQYVDQNTTFLDSDIFTSAASAGSVPVTLTPQQSYGIAITVAINSGNDQALDALATTRQSETASINTAFGDLPFSGSTDISLVHPISGSGAYRVGFVYELKNSIRTMVDVAVVGMATGFTGLTIGADYYLSNTEGQISTTPGATSVLLGKAYSTTSLLIINT